MGSTVARATEEELILTADHSCHRATAFFSIITRRGNMLTRRVSVVMPASTNFIAGPSDLVVTDVAVAV